MIKIEKKNKKKPLIIITASVLALLIASMAALFALLPESEEQSQVSSSTTKYIYNATTSSRIVDFSVDGDNGYFAAKRSSDGTYIYYYKDSLGAEQVYYPAICYTETAFDYTTLYATVDDGWNMPKISYILASLANPVYQERIEINTDDIAYGAALSVYGLDAEHRETITFTCTENRVVEEIGENGEITGVEKEVDVFRTIYIGNRLVSGTGYYVQVEERIVGYTEFKSEEEAEADNADNIKYVYACPTAENFKYALEGFTAFVTPRLIMPGNSSLGDTAMEPYLTTSYKQWTNTVHDGKDDYENPITELVTKDSIVVFKADLLTPFYSMEEDTDSAHSDGYIHSGYKSYQVDLKDIGGRVLFTRFTNAVIGSEVKKYDEDILATIIYNTNSVSLSDGVSGEYSYKIYEIDSILTDTAEYTSGTAEEYGATLIKVRYTFKDGDDDEWYEILGGESQHAVIDLTDERIPEAVRSYLRTCEVGNVDYDSASFSFTYTKENANTSIAKYVIADIVSIYEADGDDYVTASKISETSLVLYNYQLLSDGEVVDEGESMVDLSGITEESEEYLQAVKQKLVGLGVQDGINYTAYTNTEYYQFFMDFATYSIREIEYYVERELISAYKFVNPSNRNVFYGESIHENALPSNHQFKSYAVDSNSCDYVARVLGGMLVGSSSSVFEGLSGDEVVAVGLTPDNMRTYGLHAYTIYFEIPRGISENDDGDYDCYESIGFTLYISERQADGTRYVGSDMYDLIVKMDADTLYWIEEDFVDFWARRNMVMVNQTYLDRVTATVNLDDVYGKYVFDLSHPNAWILANGDLVYTLGEGESGDAYDALWVYASTSGNCSPSLLTQHLADIGKDEVRLSRIHALSYTGDASALVTVKYDELGDNNFKSFLEIIYSISYVGTLTPEEAAAATAKEPVLTLSFYVDEAVGSTAAEYGYDFYYTDDGAVAVSIYKYNSITGEHTDESCNFYISNFGFKKIIYALTDLTNGVIIETDQGFRD